MTRIEDKQMLWHTERGSFSTDSWTVKEARDGTGLRAGQLGKRQQELDEIRIFKHSRPRS